MAAEILAIQILAPIPAKPARPQAISSRYGAGPAASGTGYAPRILIGGTWSFGPDQSTRSEAIRFAYDWAMGRLSVV